MKEYISKYVVEDHAEEFTEGEVYLYGKYLNEKDGKCLICDDTIGKINGNYHEGYYSLFDHWICPDCMKSYKDILKVKIETEISIKNKFNDIFDFFDNAFHHDYDCIRQEFITRTFSVFRLKKLIDKKWIYLYLKPIKVIVCPIVYKHLDDNDHVEVLYCLDKAKSYDDFDYQKLIEVVNYYGNDKEFEHSVLLFASSEEEIKRRIEEVNKPKKKTILERIFHL